MIRCIDHLGHPKHCGGILTNRRLTVLNELYLQRGIYSVGVFNNSIWCMAGYSDATLWNMNTNQSYDFGEIGFDTAGAWKIISISGMARNLHSTVQPFRHLVRAIFLSVDWLVPKIFSALMDIRLEDMAIRVIHCGQLIRIPYTSTETALMKSAAFTGNNTYLLTSSPSNELPAFWQGVSFDIL